MTRCAEYNSTGPGPNPEQRVKWTRQLMELGAVAYTVEQILDDWKPELK